MEVNQIPEEFSQNLLLIGICLVLIVGFAATKNVVTPNQSVEVGYTEVTTECVGLNLGICLGVQQRDFTTYNYNNYTEVKEGTENYYRRVESELMIRAYNTCDSSMSGMEWTDHVEYKNKTASEWLENEQVDLLPCEKTFYRSLNATS